MLGFVTAGAVFGAGHLVLGDRRLAQGAHDLLELPAPPPSTGRILPQGEVDLSLDGGGWAAVATPTPHPQNGVVRTGSGGRARLEYDDTVLELASATQIGCASEIRSMHCVLQAGMVTVSASPGTKHIIIAIEGERAVLESKHGSFVAALRNGRLAAHNRNADLVLKAGGSEVEVPVDHVAWAAPGVVPVTARADPELRLVETRLTEGNRLLVRGHAHPLAQVSLAGAAVALDEQGDFEVTVDAPPVGSRSLEIHARWFGDGDQSLEVPRTVSDGAGTRGAGKANGRRSQRGRASSRQKQTPAGRQANEPSSSGGVQWGGGQ